MASRRATSGSAHEELADRILRAAGPASAPASETPLPALRDVRALVEDFLEVLFPGTGRVAPPDGHTPQALKHHLAAVLARLEGRLEQCVYLGLHRRCPADKRGDPCRKKAGAVAQRVLEDLPAIRTRLVQDAEVAFDSDPAATGIDEIIACYPGLYAIAIYRVANRLLHAGAPIVPRMMTEHAHSRTGIDIHPGATIGERFFIDHGTGIVVGETTRIGARVRIYQGVTLGALSVKHRQRQVEGQVRQRHPTIEDDVIIYANATILGGDTVIGKGAVVGGNAWITYSVPPGVRVGVGT